MSDNTVRDGAPIGDALTGDSSQVDVAGLRGRNRITSRAIRSVVSAITAGELHTSARAVGVELADDAGALAVTVSAPVGIAPLLGPGSTASTARPSRVDRVDRALSTPSAAGAPSSPLPDATVLERATAAQQTIRTRVLELTGSTIGTVNLRLTSARIAVDERVR
jgi:hypothetical protein